MKSHLFRIAPALLATTMLFACSSQDTASSTLRTKKSDYRFELKQVELNGDLVTLNISTDLPLPVEIMAGVSLADHKPKDIYIGSREKKIIKQSESAIIINISDNLNSLPDGDYLAEINFYPAWGAISFDSKSAPELHDSKPLSIGGTGVSADAANRRNSLQSWVFLNVDVNTKWDEGAMIGKLGKYEKSQADLSPMHDALYFLDADITMIVNRRSGELSLWRQGRQSK